MLLPLVGEDGCFDMVHIEDILAFRSIKDEVVFHGRMQDYASPWTVGQWAGSLRDMGYIEVSRAVWVNAFELEKYDEIKNILSFDKRSHPLEIKVSRRNVKKIMEYL